MVCSWIMDTNASLDLKRLEYSGEKFRQFLQRHSISYKDAAETLGIDKNTVGKAVRGGNMNIDIILRICNTYNLKITDFFKECDGENGDEGVNYYISPDADNSPPTLLLEPASNYKKCEKFEGDISTVLDVITQSNSQLIELASKYEESRRMLETISKK